MQAEVDDAEVLATLVTALAGVSLRLVDESGAVVRLIGDADKTRIEGLGDAVTARPPAGRAALVCAIGGAHTAVFSFAGDRDAELRPFLLALVEVLLAKHRIEEDMDSMNLSALAMLEEVSMLVDTMPKLPTGQTEQEVAEMGLKALVVAAGVERALYLRRQHDQCEVLVQVCMDDSGWQAVSVPYAGRPVIAEDEGSVWRALRSDKAAAFEEVPAGGWLGAEGSPEALARCQVITIPVRYGDGPQRETLGALLVMDKRDSSYAHRTELGSHEIKLATGIAAMLGSVLGTRKVTELGKELKTAKQIQSQILPDRPARARGLDFAGRVINSGAVGGDYFDYLKMSDDRTLVVVADVSGHNLASGMIMVSARATLRALAMRHSSVGRVFDDLAAALYDDLTRTERFITAVGAMISPRDRSLEFVNAGHNDSMIYRAATGQVQRIPSTDTVLGFLPAIKHDVCREVLHDGDVVLLYTDGVTEATAPDGTMLGEQRLQNLLADAAGGSATEILEAVLGAVDEFADKSGDSDDITAVVIKAVRVDGEEP